MNRNMEMFFMERQKNCDGRLPFTVSNIGRAKSQSATVRSHGFDYHQLIWLEEGSGRFDYAGKTTVLTAGQGMFMRAGRPHSYKKQGGVFSTAWVAFTCADSLLDYYKLPDFYLFDVTPEFVSRVNELRMVCTSDNTLLARSSAGYVWLSDWLESNFEPSLTVEGSVRRFLENNYDRPISLEDVAAHVGMSKYTLCHYYKQHASVSVMELLKRIRISRAKQMLGRFPLKVREVARLCGYESTSYFSKQFREMTGFTPLEYREHINKEKKQ